jgi:hypothetical protein
MRIRLYQVRAMALGSILAFVASLATAQSAPVERKFPQNKTSIEKALKDLQPNMSGRLPVLDGFAKPAEHPLARYQRGFYQATAEIVPDSSGGATVRIRAKVTAWYSDPNSSHSGYQLLVSNGRVETDLLDQLSEQLSAVPSENASPQPAASAAPKPIPTEEHPAAPEPERKFPDASGTLSSLRPNLSAAQPSSEKPGDPSTKPGSGLQAEADNLEQILKNTAHPKNLVAVKKSGTPVVSTPSLTAKPEFLASVHDEFELLDFSADWVHVRISGLSRGWIWRNSVEMPEGIADTATSSAPTAAPAADLFHVVREEMAPFPGDWEPLRGKNVKIISVQKVDEAAKNVGSKERLEYAMFLMDKSYNEITEKKQELQGVVVVFDSADGGMIGAPLAVLQQWRAGALTDSAFWHKCFFDPPEVFETAPSSGGN